VNQRGHAAGPAARGVRRKDDHPLAGVARDASTILDVVGAFERAGFTRQFAIREDGEIECLTCKHRFDAANAAVDEFRRLEGASDPDDMLAVVAITCPGCGARGTLIVNYGPVASEDDSLVLARLEPAREPSP
jgi:hypothetical protein